MGFDTNHLNRMDRNHWRNEIFKARMRGAMVRKYGVKVFDAWVRGGGSNHAWIGPTVPLR